MTSPNTKTGLGIVAIHLIDTRFMRHFPRPSSSGLPPDYTRSIDQEYTVESGEIQESEAERLFTVDLIYSVSGIAVDKSDVRTCEWESTCRYRGYFKLDNPSLLTLEDVIETHAPAYLFAFVREQVADTLRRSGIHVMLPPVAFAQSEREVPGLESTS